MSEHVRSSRMSTITDVAREAGVSVATVSRALRGLDRVSPQTRARVLQVAEELDYIASPTATSLALGRTRIVGVIAPFLTRWFFACLVSAIEKALRRRGHQVLLFDLEDSYASRLTLEQGMLWKRVDGVITLNLPLEESEIGVLDRLDLPVVAIGTPVPGRPIVRIDDAEAMRLATQHLIDLGHTDIAYVGAVPDNVAHVLTPRTRLQSFRDTMAAAGLPVREDWILRSEWTADGAYADAAQLVREPEHERPTAVVAASDEMAIGVLQAAIRAGLSCPKDLSVVGIDDHEFAAVMGLTTVRQDVQAQGEAAATLLLDALVNDVALAPDDQRILPVKLVVRESTAPPRER